MRKQLLPLLFIASASTAFAEDSATTFAIQAGSIAGAAQACGQDVTEFSNRVNQSLTVLADSTTQINQARDSYLAYAQSAAKKQSETHAIPCSQVIQDYNAMPIMQPDYHSSVIEKFKKVESKQTTFLPTEPITGPQNTGESTAGIPNSVTFPNPDRNVSPAGVPNSLTFPGSPSTGPAIPVPTTTQASPETISSTLTPGGGTSIMPPSGPYIPPNTAQQYVTSPP